MVDILVTGKKISDMDLATEINGDEKIPTGSAGDVAITPDQLVEYVRNTSNTSWGKIIGDIDSQLDLKNRFLQSSASLSTHVDNKENPHEVTKAQIGLGNVDNTSDVNKPVSSATQTVLDTKADKSYVDEELLLKTDKTNFSNLVEELKTGSILGFDSNFSNAIGGYPLHARIMLTNGDIVRNTIANNTNDPNDDMAGWAKINSTSQIFDASGMSQKEINNQLRYYLTPEMFYQNTDGADWLAAFQRMSNKALELGGATCILTKDSYYLSEFLPSQVSKSLWRNNLAKSKIWYIAPKMRIISACGWTTLNINGGSSAPFGWNTSANVLTVGDEELSYSVVSVDSTNKKVTLASGAPNFTSGMQTQLYREGGDYSAGIARTPSRERAPCQILTVDSVSGNDIVFKENFIHKFETRGDLLLSKQATSASKYPDDIFFDGIEFKAGDGTKPYILFSRQLNGGFGSIKLNGCSGSYGMGQGFIGSDFKLYNQDFTIESVSDWHINSYYCENNTGDSPYGLLLNDNARNWRIDKFTARGYKRMGAQILFGFNGSIGEATIESCGISGTPTLTSQNYTGLVVGMLNNGFYGSKAASASPAFLRKNLGYNDLVIEKLNIFGFNKRAILAGDISLKINSAKIEYDDSSNLPIIQVGDTGKSLNDPTYYTDRAHSSIVIESLDITTKSGSSISPQKIIDQRFGIDGLLFAKPVKLVSAAAPTETTIEVDDASLFYQYINNIYFVNPASNSIAAVSKAISSISGNIVTLSESMGVSLPAGTEIWTTPPIAGLGQFNNCYVDIKNITINGLRVPSIKVLPYSFLSIDASSTATKSIKVPLGASKLRVYIQEYGTTLSMPFYNDIMINNTAGRELSVINASGGNTSIKVTASSVSNPVSNVVDITFTSTRTSNSRLYITWEFV